MKLPESYIKRAVNKWLQFIACVVKRTCDIQ